MERLTVQDLAMFLGCDLKHNDLDYLDGELTPELLAKLHTEQRWKFYKPILRPLSDMTDEEEKYLRDALISALSQEEHQRQVAENFKYLIQKHFDVFGWIKKGLALDKTKLEVK